MGRNGILKVGMENVWEDSDKAVDMESLHSDESSLPVEAAFPSLPEGIKPALTEKTVSSCHESQNHTGDSPQNSPSPLSFCF